MCATCGCSGEVTRSSRSEAGRPSGPAGARGPHDAPDQAHSSGDDARTARSHSHDRHHDDRHHDDHHDDDHHHGDHDHHHADHHHDDRHHEPKRGRIVELEQDLLAKNDGIASRNRTWLQRHGVLAVNLMSSPGAGKTSLLERTLSSLSRSTSITVIEGDQETSRDAERIRATGCRVVQINTGAGCHLDAEMVSEALRALDPPEGSIVMIENVGNLVCPALFDLGEAVRVVVMSVTEGEDKPVKYPHMFRSATLMLLNKVDLLPHVDFDVARCLEFARRANPNLDVLPVSASHGDGLDGWYEWIQGRSALARRSAARSAERVS